MFVGIHCAVKECVRDENNCILLECTNVRFNLPIEYEKVTYNDFWNNWSNNEKCFQIYGEDWKGFYRHKSDTLIKICFVLNKNSVSHKPTWKQYSSYDSTLRMYYTGYLFGEKLTKNLYFDTESDKNKDSLLITEVVGRVRTAWRYKRLSEFQDMEYCEPIDSMYHYELTIHGRIFMGFDVARDTLFPIEEYRKEAFRIWNAIEFDD